MAAGLVLVATLTGGTKEILVDGENGLAFQPEDALGLAAQLRRWQRRRICGTDWPGRLSRR